MRRVIKGKFKSAISAISAVSAPEYFKKTVHMEQSSKNSLTTNFINMKSRNTLDFYGSQEQMQLVTDWLQNSEGIVKLTVDFDLDEDSIMPSCLDVEHSSGAERAYKILFNRQLSEDYHLMQDSRYHIASLPKAKQEHTLKLAIQYFHNIQETGFAHYKEWSQYTGYDHTQAPEGKTWIEFYTEGIPMLDLIMDISIELPSIVIRYSFSNEVTENTWIIEGGKIVNEIEE